mmetsp:Transcript_7691/g.11417  ORF Transcript_7691/g.11417 Transcript_7691/m.11417 type:complete len:890 (+) Transcript_7691:40-2709(+)|eukprot:CAMPEP_0117421896 /NCGR_PEP_ID=MMETSP0758-20121206/2850_1 /TAXON_ID=63605 /ORGANISM="Percolomonas cosmopolitus, Strain AE-1 (ATCC 50343)" /LENGTH=889 /DNA_ID=CAMNT_0005204203 /DNA_START=15 /DNA_END=2684 /DNA_ORIENTATION=-
MSEDLRQTNISLEEELSKLKVTLEQKDQDINRIEKDRTSEKERYEKSLERSEERIKKLQSDITDNEKIQHQTQDELQQARQKITDLEHEIETSKGDSSSSKTQLEDLNKKLEDKSEYASSLLEKIELLEKEKATSEAEIEKGNLELERLKNSISSMEGDKATQITEKEEYLEKINALSDEKIDLLKKLKDKEDAFDTLERKHDAQTEEYESFREEKLSKIDDLSVKLTTLSEKTENAFKDYQRMEKEVAELTKERDVLQEAKTNNLKRIQTLEESNQQLEDLLSQSTTDGEATNKGLALQLNQLKENHQVEIEQLKQSLSSTKEVLEHELEEAKESSELKYAELKKNMNDAILQKEREMELQRNAYEEEIRTMKESTSQKLQMASSRADSTLGNIKADQRQTLLEVQTMFQTATQQIVQRYQKTILENKTQYESTLSEVSENYTRTVAEKTINFENALDSTRKAIKEVMGSVKRAYETSMRDREIEYFNGIEQMRGTYESKIIELVGQHKVELVDAKQEAVDAFNNLKEESENKIGDMENNLQRMTNELNRRTHDLEQSRLFLRETVDTMKAVQKQSRKIKKSFHTKNKTIEKLGIELNTERLRVKRVENEKISLKKSYANSQAMDIINQANSFASSSPKGKKKQLSEREMEYWARELSHVEKKCKDAEEKNKALRERQSNREETHSRAMKELKEKNRDVKNEMKKLKQETKKFYKEHDDLETKCEVYAKKNHKLRRENRQLSLNLYNLNKKLDEARMIHEKTTSLIEHPEANMTELSHSTFDPEELPQNKKDIDKLVRGVKRKNGIGKVRNGKKKRVPKLPLHSMNSTTTSIYSSGTARSNASTIPSHRGTVRDSGLLSARESNILKTDNAESVLADIKYTNSPKHVQ